MRRAQIDCNSQPVRNLFTNPSGEAVTATTTILRTNLCPSPRGVNAFGEYSSLTAQTITANVPITGHPEGLTTANRVVYGSGSNPGVALFNVVAGTTYTVSAWIMNEVVQANPGNMAFAELGVTTGTNISSTVGDWQRITWTRTATSSGLIGFRVASASGGPTNASFLITGVTAEAVSAAAASPVHFDGASPASGDFTFQWSGIPHASPSTMRGLVVPAISSSGSAGVIQSTAWSSSGSKSVRIIHLPISSIAEGNLADITVVKPGVTYTVIGKFRVDTVATTSHTRARRFNLYVSTNGGGSYAETNGPQAPNAIGVYPLRFTFTIPINATHAILRIGGHSFGSTAVMQADAWWDDLMLVEGVYDGDYIDGTKPFSKWDGAANASTSVGYPPQLLDIAGKPLVDVSAIGSVNLPGGFTPAEARTIYTVYNNFADINDGQVYPILTYGSTALNDVIPNTYITIRQQAAAGANNNVLSARRTGGAGSNINGAIVGANVSAWGLQDNGRLFMVVNNGPVSALDPQVMDLLHERINVLPATAYSSHIRTIIYRGYHDAATRAAISRYLGNKYGAPVA